MIQSSDVEGRLRLFRYGLIVIVAITFLVSLLAPYVIAAPWAAQFNAVLNEADQVDVSIGTFLSNALVITLIVAVVMAIAYFIYRSYLLKSASPARA